MLARGYAGLVAALVMDLGAFPARHVRENWVGEAAPGRQLLRPVAPRAGAVLAALTTINLIHGYRGLWRRFNDHSLVWEAGVSVLPSILAFTVPISLLLGLVMGLGRLAAGSGSTRRWMAPATGVSLAVAAGVFVLCAWIVPVANQSVREIVVRVLAPSPDARLRALRTPGFVKGHRELTLPELTVRIREERRVGTAPAILVVEWHKKLVIPLFCAFLGPLAVGLTTPLRGRVPSGGRSFAFAALLLGVFFASWGLAETAVRNGQVAPLVGVWATAVIPALGAIGAVGHRRSDGPHSFRNEYER